MGKNLSSLDVFPIRNHGYCHCCEKQVEFVAETAYLRDSYQCLNCHSIPRQRALLHYLDSKAINWRQLQIHESSPCNSQLFSKKSPHYSFSHYFKDEEYGKLVGGIRNENLENLSFSENIFDIFITQDVLEHVFDPAKVLNEIVRVLRPGGFHIFTVPVLRHQKTQCRALSKVDKIEFIHPAIYHGNPMDPLGSLLTWDFGTDFSEFVKQWTGLDLEVHKNVDRSLGIDGELLEVFIMRKPYE